MLDRWDVGEKVIIDEVVYFVVLDLSWLLLAIFPDQRSLLAICHLLCLYI